MQNSQAISCRCIRYFACRYAWCLAYLRFTADAGPGESSENENWIPDVPTRSVSIWHPQDILCLEILFIIQTIKYLPVLPFPGQPFMHGKFLFSILSEMKCSFWKHHYLSIFVNWFHFQGLICCLFKLQIL